jgi:hypothetical protein
MWSRLIKLEEFIIIALSKIAPGLESILEEIIRLREVK